MSDQGGGELRLNSVARFQKRSSDLVLEEHGSCEVPAGCGGVVLRWVRRGQQQGALTLTLETNGPFRAWIDGQAVENASVWLGVGDHALAVELTAPDSSHACLVQGFARVRAPAGLTDRLRTRADGTWLATTVAPADDAWKEVSFVPDEGWRPLEAHGWSLPRREYVERWLEEEGAEPLGLASSGNGPVWVRTTFRLVLDRSGGAP